MELPEKFRLPALKPASESLAGVLAQANAMKGNHNASDITEALIKIAHAKEALQNQMDELNAIEIELRTKIVPEVYGEKTKTINCLGYRATLVEKVKASVVAENKLSAFDWKKATCRRKISSESICSRTPP
jgi:hypothetical protein